MIAWPWHDRTGRFSRFKLAVFGLTLLPGLWVALQAAAGWLQPRPLAAAIHQTGQWAVWVLLVSLAVTPLRHLGHWPRVMTVRRMIGLAALAYAVLHLFLYTGDQAFDLAKVGREIIARVYLAIGFTAFLGLLVLGATSTDAMIRRLGGARWRAVHRGVYAIAVLGLVHFLLQAKLDIGVPVITAGAFLWLMGWRVLHRFAPASGLLGLTGLAVGAAVGAAGLEAGWYAALTGVDAARVLSANWMWALAPRPAWWVLAGGLAVVALVSLRRFSGRLPSAVPVSG